jgi:hypothetical protein
MAKIRSIVRPNGMNIPTKPVIHSAIKAPNRNGPIPEKSYFDWKVNSVRPRNTPAVIILGGVKN